MSKFNPDKTAGSIRSNDPTIMTDIWFLDTWQKVVAAYEVKMYGGRVELNKEEIYELYEMLGVDDVLTKPREVTVKELREHREREVQRHGEEQVRSAAAQ